MQASGRQQSSWRISPAIPTIANLALAALWAFSAFGGWGMDAFCVDEWKQPNCFRKVDFVTHASYVPAAVAAFVALGAWLLPGVRRRTHWLNILLTVAALCWFAAEAILFVGGHIARSGLSWI